MIRVVRARAHWDCVHTSALPDAYAAVLVSIERLGATGQEMCGVP